MAQRKIVRKTRYNSTSTSADVSSPTSTSADVSSPTSTKTATDAYTGRNITVTGGAGSGATNVRIAHQPDGPEAIGRSHRSEDGDLQDAPMESQFRGGKNEPLQSRFRENKGKGKRGKCNPGSAEYQSALGASEAFHGIDTSEVFEVACEVFEHDNLGDLGELISMEIAPVNGGRAIVLHGFAGARLAQAPKGFPFQLFIEGGDQAVDLAEFDIDEPHEKEVLGKLKRIKYYTVKHHLGKDGGEANYKHKLGEIDGKLPTVIYDCMNESLEIAGGGYTILAEGIDN